VLIRLFENIDEVTLWVVVLQSGYSPFPTYQHNDLTSAQFWRSIASREQYFAEPWSHSDAERAGIKDLWLQQPLSSLDDACTLNLQFDPLKQRPLGEHRSWAVESQNSLINRSIKKLSPEVTDSRDHSPRNTNRVEKINLLGGYYILPTQLISLGYDLQILPQVKRCHPVAHPYHVSSVMSLTRRSTLPPWYKPYLCFHQHPVHLGQVFVRGSCPSPRVARHNPETRYLLTACFTCRMIDLHDWPTKTLYMLTPCSCHQAISCFPPHDQRNRVWTLNFEAGKTSLHRRFHNGARWWHISRQRYMIVHQECCLMWMEHSWDVVLPVDGIGNRTWTWTWS
jgi:hypothetical protein